MEGVGSLTLIMHGCTSRRDVTLHAGDSGATAIVWSRSPSPPDEAQKRSPGRYLSLHSPRARRGGLRHLCEAWGDLHGLVSLPGRVSFHSFAPHVATTVACPQSAAAH